MASGRLNVNSAALVKLGAIFLGSRPILHTPSLLSPPSLPPRSLSPANTLWAFKEYLAKRALTGPTLPLVSF